MQKLMKMLSDGMRHIPIRSPAVMCSPNSVWLISSIRSIRNTVCPSSRTPAWWDRDIGFWPVDGNLEDVRGKTIRFWKEYNHISTKKELDDTMLTGLAADETAYLDENQRYVP